MRIFDVGLEGRYVSVVAGWSGLTGTLGDMAGEGSGVRVRTSAGTALGGN